MRFATVRNALSLILAATLVLTLGLHAPALAAPDFVHPAGQKSVPVPAKRVPVQKPAPGNSPPALTGAVPDAAWPTGAAEVAVTSSLRNAGQLPVQVKSAGADSPAKVRIEFLDRQAAERAGIAGVLVRVADADGPAARAAAGPPAKVPVRIDYRAFRNLFGGDWASRLRLVSVPECALSTPSATDCAPVPVSSSHDRKAGAVSATASLGARGSTLLALAPGAAGPAGDFGATPIAPSSSWQAGGGTGDFSWSYPLRVPPALGGAAPKLSFDYSSQSVDGRTAATNNQPSMLGEGFSYSPGYVERRFKQCAEDMDDGANNSKKTGDLCQSDAQSLVLSLNGSSVELIYNKGENRWHPKKDDGTKVERKTEAGFANGDGNHEYWKATTTDGVQYFFGHNRLPGWSANKPETKSETKSVWTVPVAGNNTGEDCHKSAFVDSFCDEAWRWNLDYVVDPMQNTMSYWYEPETNFYGRNNDATKRSKYIRGGMLKRIDYGTRADTIFGTAPAQVLFEPADRCSTTSDCDPTVKANWKNWLDTPLDRGCKQDTDCKDNFAPTFWSTKRLAKVTTQVWGGAKYRPVDSWSLRAFWPKPVDGNHAGLWLAGITHTGHVGTAITLPETVLTGTRMNNRVDTSGDNIHAYAWMRLTSVTSETGGQTAIFYTDPQCVAGSNVPTDHDSNKMRCYPVKWQPEGFGGKITDYFHKYLVRAVTETDLTGGSPPVKNVYEYIGQPAWHRDLDNGLVKKSHLTWGEWRGYEGVRVLRGEADEQTKTETTFFRGMDGDLLSGGGKRNIDLPAIDQSPAAPDSEAFAGMVREERTYDGDTLISGTVSTPWQSDPTATRGGGELPVESRYVNVAAVRTRVKIDHGSGWLRTAKAMAYDGYGMLVRTDDSGDIAVVGSDTVPGDESCTKTTYARNDTTWIMDRPVLLETYARPCSVAPKSADDVIGITRTFYDGATTAGKAPTLGGNPTRVETLATWTSPTAMTFVAEQRATYDAYGRTEQSWDLSGIRKLTAYGIVAGGGVNKVTTTTFADSKFYDTSVEIDPAWGAQTASVDMNKNRTDITLDALGRTAAVWQPGRSRSATASATFTYKMRNDGAVSTRSDTINAAGNYVTTYTIFDSLLRQRQVQTTSPTKDARIITETRYDTAGREVLRLGPMVNLAKPGPDLVTSDATLVYPQQRTVYDRAGRNVATVFQPRGKEAWRTSTYHGGDHIDTTPPRGGTATSVYTDSRGKTLTRKQYAPNTDADSGVSTAYTYNRKGTLTAVTDPAGNKWEYKQDIRGRQTWSKDPDKGAVDYTYDAADRLTSVTDARGAASALKYTYDGMSRKTGVYDKATNAKRATWAYDTAPGGKGALASSSRWAGTAEYKTAVRGYDVRNRSTGTTTTLPAAEGVLAGDYSFIIGYNNTTDGSLAGYTFGGRADLLPETVFYNYDPLTGLPSSMDSDYPQTNAYVKSTAYTGAGQLSGFVLTTDKRATSEVYRDYVWDLSTGRLDHSTTSTTVKGVVSDPHYTYDPSGNVISISDPLYGDTDTQCFTQDYLQRLTEAWTPDSGDCDPARRADDKLGGPAPYWQSWTYDDIGNRLTQTDRATSAGTAVTDFNTPDGKHALASTSGAMTGTYAYDPIGNLERRPTGTGHQVLTWDAEGHLATIAQGGATTSFTYDASGARLLRKDATTTTVYLGDVEIRLNRASGALAETRTYKWAEQNIGQRTKTGVAWLINDHQNTANIAINATTHQVTARLQTPFGGTRGPAPTWPNQRGFLGGQQDPSGLTHLGAREYDPVTGRFISVDPVLDVNDLQQMHGYSYANNSPVSSCDPTGLLPIDDAYGPGTASGTTPPANGGGGSGGGGGANEEEEKWYTVYKERHESAIAARVVQIRQKWPKARVTITMADNFIKGGSAKANGAAGYADIICWDCDPGRVYVWEMKNKGGPAEQSGPAQLTRYVQKLQEQIDTAVAHPNAGSNVVEGPRFNADTITPNRSKPNELLLVEDSKFDGIQVYSVHDPEKTPAPAPTPTATETPAAEETDPPVPTDRRIKPSPSMRAPELPESEPTRVGAPDAGDILVAVAVVAVVVVVIACAPAAVAVGAGVAAGVFLFSW